MRFFTKLSCFVYFFLSNVAFSQLDSIHYLQPLIFAEYSDATITNDFIYLSTPSVQPITVNLTYPDGVTSPRISITYIKNNDVTTNNSVKYVSDGVVTLSNSEPVRIRFVNANDANISPGNHAITIPKSKAGKVISSNEAGILLKSKSEFYANYRGRSDSQAGSILSKGKAAFGKQFYWGGTPIELSTTVSALGNLLSITATENDTEITVDNFTKGIVFHNITYNEPKLNIKLNKGESYLVFANVIINGRSIQDDGWLGARISSNNNILVTVGGLLQQGGENNLRDIGLDQLVPVDNIGNEYIVMRGRGNSSNTSMEKIVVVFTEDDTNISINGKSISDSDLKSNYTSNQSRNFRIIPGTHFIDNNIHIKSDKPIYVFHKIFGDNNAATNSFMFIPPLSCNAQTTVDLIPHAKHIGATAYDNTLLSVLARKGSAFKPLVTLNSTILNPSNTDGFSVTGNDNWVSYRYDIAKVGHVKVSSLGTIQAELLGANGDAGFGGYYTGFAKSENLKVVIDNKRFDSACTGDTGTTILRSELDGFVGEYQWYKNGEPILGANAPIYDIPEQDSEIADYFMSVTLNDGCIYLTEVVTSTKCPCYKPYNNLPPEYSNSVGISTMEKRSTQSWPNDIPNSFLTLESSNKGLVITRNDDPENNIPIPVKGMMVYDSDDKCVKLFNGTKWGCIKKKCYDYDQ